MGNPKTLVPIVDHFLKVVSGSRTAWEVSAVVVMGVVVVMVSSGSGGGGGQEL